jgi:hypothetical protein
MREIWWKVGTVLLGLGAATTLIIGVNQMIEEDERRTRRKMIRMKYTKRLRRLDEATSKIAKSTQELERNMAIAAKQKDYGGDEKKVSSYYFFNSSGSKNKNKWDTFKDEEDVSEKKSSHGPTLPENIRDLKKKTLECREMTKKIDQVAADMAADRERVGVSSEKLILKRKRMAQRVATLEQHCEALLKRAQNLLVMKREQNQDETKDIKSKTTPSTPIRKPLTEEEKARLDSKKDGSTSKWNQSGRTWEERDVTKHATEILHRYLSNTSVVMNGANIRVVNVDSLNGSASTLVHADPPKFIFEYSFVLSWKSDRGTNGTLRFAEIDVLSIKSDDEDLEASGRSVDKGDHTIGLQHAKALEREVGRSLGLFFDELTKSTPLGK